MSKNNFKLIASLIAAVVFISSGTVARAVEPSPPALSQAEHDALHDIWQGCLVSAIRELDDHISTASDIAAGVQNSCRAEYDSMTRSFNFPPEINRRLDEERTARTKELAMILVLRVRAADRAKANKK